MLEGPNGGGKSTVGSIVGKAMGLKLYRPLDLIGGANRVSTLMGFGSSMNDFWNLRLNCLGDVIALETALASTGSYLFDRSTLSAVIYSQIDQELGRRNTGRVSPGAPLLIWEDMLREFRDSIQVFILYRRPEDVYDNLVQRGLIEGRREEIGRGKVQGDKDTLDYFKRVSEKYRAYYDSRKDTLPIHWLDATKREPNHVALDILKWEGVSFE